MGQNKMHKTSYQYLTQLDPSASIQVHKSINSLPKIFRIKFEVHDLDLKVTQMR